MLDHAKSTLPRASNTYDDFAFATREEAGGHCHHVEQSKPQVKHGVSGAVNEVEFK